MGDLADPRTRPAAAGASDEEIADPISRGNWQLVLDGGEFSLVEPSRGRTTDTGTYVVDGDELTLTHDADQGGVCLPGPVEPLPRHTQLGANSPGVPLAWTAGNPPTCGRPSSKCTHQVGCGVCGARTKLAVADSSIRPDVRSPTLGAASRAPRQEEVRPMRNVKRHAISRRRLPWLFRWQRVWRRRKRGRGDDGARRIRPMTSRGCLPDPGVDQDQLMATATEAGFAEQDVNAFFDGP